MITISNISVTLEGSSAPTLFDIGYALSKIPRFGGHTTKHWTVLHHVYASTQYAHLVGGSVKVQLHALLHDSDEAVTEDIPHPWKTEDMRALQKDIRIRIYNSLHLSPPDMATEREVKRIDSQMCYAEALWAAPQAAKPMLIPGPNFRDSIDPMDSKGDLAVQRASSMLAGIIMDPYACGNDFRRYFELLTMDYDSPTPASEDADD